MALVTIVHVCGRTNGKRIFVEDFQRIKQQKTGCAIEASPPSHSSVFTMEPSNPFHTKPLEEFYERTKIITVRVKSIPQILANDHMGDPIIFDYKQEYQVGGIICLSSTFPNAEDAINTIVQRSGYHVVEPSEMAYRLEHVKFVERMYGTLDGGKSECFLVFEQPRRKAPCVGEIEDGHCLVTLSRLWRESEDDALYVVSGIGCDDSVAHPSRTIEGGMSFPKLSHASEWCEHNELHPLDAESEKYWKFLLNSKNRKLPTARYSFAREVLYVYSVCKHK
jgi:hypothetical protein